jgi:hypothetical protein
MKKYFLSALALPLLFACSSEDYLDQKATDNDQFAGIEKVDATFTLADSPKMRLATQWGAEVGDRLGFAWLTNDYTGSTTTTIIPIDGQAYQNHPLFLKNEDGVNKFVPETSIYVGKYFVYYPFDETTTDIGKINFKSLEDQPLTDGQNQFKAIAVRSINIGDKFTEVIPGGRTDAAGKVWDEPGIKASYKLNAAPFSNQTGLDLTYQKNNPTFAAAQRIQGATDIDFTIAAGEEVGAAAIYSGTVQLAGASKSFTYAPTTEPNPAPAVHSATFWATQSNVASKGFVFTAGPITLKAEDEENGVTTKDKTTGWFWFNSLPVDAGNGDENTTVSVALQTSYGTVTVPAATVKDCAWEYVKRTATSPWEWIKLTDAAGELADATKWDVTTHNTFINQYGDHKGKYALTVDFSTGDMSTLHIKNDNHLQTVLRYYIATGKSNIYQLNLDKDAAGEFKISKKSIALLQTINRSSVKVTVQPCALDGTHAPTRIVVTQDGTEGKTEVPNLDKVFAVATHVYLSSDCEWTWKERTAPALNQLTIDANVAAITNEGTLTVNATNIELSTNTVPLYNAAGATMNITKVTTVKDALTNLGTINVPAGAELRAYDVEIKNDATSLTDYGVINNAGVVGVTYATTGTVNNYGKIIMENSDAITLLTSNQTGAGNFNNAFNAGTNKLGTVVLPAGQPNALVSVSNGAETGFIEYTWTGSTTYDTPNGGIVKYNTLIVSDNIAFTAAETEIRFIKFEGVKKTVTNSTNANLPNLKGIIIKDNCSIIIEKSNTISCSEGSHLGNGAAVYNGGAFTPGNTNIVGKTVTDYLGTWNTDQIVVW